jgi:hypothetical protein
VTGEPNWFWWVVAALVAGLFGAFFFLTGVHVISAFRRLVGTIQNWPQIRRAMVEAEARSGGRYPFWLRALRAALILSMIGLMAYVVWRRMA